MAAFCLSFHAAYRCAHSGECCTAGWPIPAEPALLSVLERGGLGPRWTPERASARIQRPEGPIRVLATDPDDACVFFERDRRLCTIHRVAGADTLPSACRNFPRVTLHDRRGAFITLSHYCPTAASMLLNGEDIAIVLAPPSLSLNGTVEGLDATAVLPPLLRPGMLMDDAGYAAWEAEAVAVFNERNLSARQALAVIGEATRDACAWQPGGVSLASRVHDAFDRARTRVQPPALTASPEEHAVKSFLAAHLFASWCGYQDGGLGAIVADVERTLETLTRARATSPFIAAVRAADFHLRHSRTDAGPRSIPSLRRD